MKRSFLDQPDDIGILKKPYVEGYDGFGSPEILCSADETTAKKYDQQFRYHIFNEPRLIYKKNVMYFENGKEMKFGLKSGMNVWIYPPRS